MQEETGLLLDPYFSATKMRWLVENEPAVAAAAQAGRLALGTVESWLLFKLTGGAHLSDASNASRTLLLPRAEASWDEGLCDLFGVPRAALPEVTDNAGRFGKALPEWFGAVNRDLRYQLTVIGTFAQAIVSEKVKNNRFTIRTNAPNVEVSWQVTGVRSDPAMRKRPFNAEENKPERERGHYLHPDLYGQPEERSVEWARNPQLMQQRKEARERSKQQ